MIATWCLLLGPGGPGTFCCPCRNFCHPCHCCALQGPANLESICMLVELGADVEATLAARSLETPLHIAARSGRGDILSRLLVCPNVR